MATDAELDALGLHLGNALYRGAADSSAWVDEPFTHNVEGGPTIKVDGDILLRELARAAIEALDRMKKPASANRAGLI